MGGQFQDASGDISGERPVPDLTDPVLKGTDGLLIDALPGPCRGDKKTNTSGCDGSGE